MYNNFFLFEPPPLLKKKGQTPSKVRKNHCKFTTVNCFIGNVSSLEAAPGESNVIKLESGKSVVVKLTFEAAENSSYEFSATLDNGIAINTSSATIENGTIAYVIYSHFMSGVSFGSYSVIFSMVDNMNSVAAKEKEMFLQYEERITGFTVYDFKIITSCLYF